MKDGRRIAVLGGLALVFVLKPSWGQEVHEEVQRLDTEARAEEKQGHLDAAIQKYEAIVRLTPRNPAAYSNVGRLYYQMGRFQEALAPLRQATEIDPKLEPPRALLGFSYYQMGDFESARREFKAAVALSPHDGNAKLFLARSMLELNDVRGALRLLEELQQQAPHNAEVLYSLGSVYAGLAASTLDAIQTADPNSYLIELLLGKYAEVKQVYPEAVIHYKKAIEKAPAVLDLYYRLAHAYWESGDFSNALAAYRYTLKVNPYDDRACWEAARIEISDNPEEAFHLADRALHLKPNIPEALNLRGRAALALRKPADAVEDFKKASKLDPGDATNHFQLARAYRQLGLTAQAEEETAIYVRMQGEAHSPKEDQQAAPQ